MTIPPLSDPVANLPPLRVTIADHGLSARRRLGQNFLLDMNLTTKIARLALTDAPPSTTMIEVGAGPGGLTRALLLAGARRVIAIEKDPRCVPALRALSEVAGDRLRIIGADALDLDIAALAPPPRRIAANLPYNIATRLLIGWLKQATDLQTLTLMFQKEVAQRIVARPGAPGYSRLSVLCNWRCETRLLFVVPARAFTPTPNVTSAVVSLRPRLPTAESCVMEDLEAVTAAAFGQRRKTLRRALASLPVPAEALLANADIDPSLRAEVLSIEDFARLARRFRQMAAQESNSGCRPHLS